MIEKINNVNNFWENKEKRKIFEINTKVIASSPAFMTLAIIVLGKMNLTLKKDLIVENKKNDGIFKDWENNNRKVQFRGKKHSFKSI